MLVCDIDCDDTLEMVFCGVNNSLQPARNTEYVPIAFAFRPRMNEHSQAFPGAFPDMPVSVGVWYVVIPPAGGSLLPPTIEKRGRDGGPMVKLQTQDGRFYYLNSRCELVGVAAGDNWKEQHPSTGIPTPLQAKFEAGEWQLEPVSTKIKEGTPDLGYLHLNRALHHYGRGDFDSAVVELETAAMLSPEVKEYADLWLVRARKHGEYGFLGAQLENAPSGGARIAKTVFGTPAQTAGLQEGDVVRGIGSVSIANSLELNRELARRNPGDRVELLVERGGNLSKQSVVLSSPSDVR